MYRSSPARKYGPLALLAAAQLVVVLVAPSTAPSSTEAELAGGTFDSGVTAVDGGGGVAADGTALDAGSGDPALDGTAGTGGDLAGGGTVDSGGGATSGGGGTSGGSTGSTGSTGGGTATSGGGSTGSTGGSTRTAGGTTTTGGTTSSATGSTAHCVEGRQFDPKIDFYAPPCVPGVPGAAAANPGATSLGVTKDKVLIVHYLQDYGAEVNAILRAQGLYYDASDARVFNAAFQKFMNTKYNLHGRKIEIRTFQGTCRTVPPDQQCLNAEMNKIAKQFKPFAVYFPGTVCSACYAELARNKVVTFGGAGFSEEFRNALKPYNYDAGMSSTRMAQTFAEFWCKQMAGKNAVYAGTQNPAQNFRTMKRQIGVVSTNDPDNEKVIRGVLYPALAKCGTKVNGHEYFYEQNVGTAATQSQAGTAIMNSRTNPATSVVCFCDPVAPQFSYNAATNNNYWPEVLFASNQALDVDTVGQTYMSGLACPQPQRGCAFDGCLRHRPAGGRLGRVHARRREGLQGLEHRSVAGQRARPRGQLDVLQHDRQPDPGHGPGADAGPDGGGGADARQPWRRHEDPQGLRAGQPVLDPRRAHHVLEQAQAEPLQQQGRHLHPGGQAPEPRGVPVGVAAGRPGRREPEVGRHDRRPDPRDHPGRTGRARAPPAVPRHDRHRPARRRRPGADDHPLLRGGQHLPDLHERDGRAVAEQHPQRHRAGLALRDHRRGAGPGVPDQPHHQLRGDGARRGARRSSPCCSPPPRASATSSRCRSPSSAASRSAPSPTS